MLNSQQFIEFFELKYKPPSSPSLIDYNYTHCRTDCPNLFVCCHATPTRTALCASRYIAKEEISLSH